MHKTGTIDSLRKGVTAMAMKFIEEQLNSFYKPMLSLLFLNQREQLKRLVLTCILGCGLQKRFEELWRSSVDNCKVSIMYLSDIMRSLSFSEYLGTECT